MPKAKVKKSDLWKAIKLHCFQCCGESRKEQEACEIDTCPLWPYRLGKKFSEKSSVVVGISEKKEG
jgi:hypothetical protein